MTEESKNAAVVTAKSDDEMKKSEEIKVETAAVEAAPAEDLGKSNLTEDDLVKSLEKIEEMAKSETPDARKQTLLAKAQQSDLAIEEREELFRLMGGEQSESFGTEISKSLSADDNDAIQKAIDISDYVSELHSGLVKALASVGDRVEKSESHQHEVNLVMAKGLLDMGKLAQQTQQLVKSLADDVAQSGRQPVRAPRSHMGGTQVISKSMAGAPGAEDRISKSEVHDLLHGMLLKSMKDGRDGAAQCGEDINSAATRFELEGQISNELMTEVATFRRGKMNGVA